MFLAGDAAGFIDPFAGDGISLALQSGTLAAQSIIPFLRGAGSLEQAHAQYKRHTVSGLHRHFAMRPVYAAHWPHPSGFAALL